MIYNYKCTRCGEIFEVWATLAEKGKGLRPRCPKCSSEDARQMIGTINLAGNLKTGGSMDMPPMCGPAAGPGCC